MTRQELAARAVVLAGGVEGWTKGHDPHGYFRLVTEGRQITWTDPKTGDKRAYSACEDLASRLALEACGLKQGMAWCNRVDGGNKWISGQNLIRIKKFAAYAWKNYGAKTEWDIELGDAVQVMNSFGPHTFVVTRIERDAAGKPVRVDTADYGQYFVHPATGKADHGCRCYPGKTVARDSKGWTIGGHRVIGRLDIAAIAERELGGAPAYRAPAYAEDDDEPTTPGKPTPVPFSWRTLRHGMTGPDVKAWQDQLVRDGYSVGPAGADGVFGTRTTSATRAWQRDRGLVADGVVGSKTRGMIGKPKLRDPRAEPGRTEVLFAFPGLERTTAEFRDAFVAMCARLGIPDPNKLAPVPSIESGFDPQAQNPFLDSSGRSAIGLIQFMPFLLDAWGLDWHAVKRMTGVEQLPLVERFYRAQNVAGVDDPGTFYMLTFLPKYARHPDSFVLGEKDSEEIRDGLSLHKIYAQNAGLDRDKDGDIEVGEVKRLARDRYELGRSRGVYKG